MVGICFFIASLFRDHIARLFGFFPILNLFGPKGAGKTELAISLLQFFGPQVKGPNITNTTKAALADHVALFSNTLCHIDEYKNNLEYEKIEFLKGLWDGTGRTRMNMDKDKKKETTSVDCAIILSGQEMPTVDIALFSRLIFLGFTKVEYDDNEKGLFNRLKDIEKHSLTHITHDILQHREVFKKDYMDNYNAAGDELTKEIGNIVIEDRTFRNWLVILAAFRTLNNIIKIPWHYNDLVSKSAQLIIRQNSDTKKSNEISTFWSIVESLTKDEKLREEVDFYVEYINYLKTDKGNYSWSQAKNILYLDKSRVFSNYQSQGNRENERPLPTKTLEYHLKNSNSYLGIKHSVNFRVTENNKVVQDMPVDNIGGPSKTQKKYKTTDALCFDYDMLGISILTVTVLEDPENDDPKLPF